MSKEVEEAKTKCNLFIQAGATINLVDCNKKGQVVFKTFDTTAIETILKYIEELEKKNICLTDEDYELKFQNEKLQELLQEK